MVIDPIASGSGLQHNKKAQPQKNRKLKQKVSKPICDDTKAKLADALKWKPARENNRNDDIAELTSLFKTFNVKVDRLFTEVRIVRKNTEQLLGCRKQVVSSITLPFDIPISAGELIIAEDALSDEHIANDLVSKSFSLSFIFI